MEYDEIITSNNRPFNWKRLLDKIKRKKVIPVVGHGVYRILVGENSMPLYDFLAEKLAEEIDRPLDSNVSHKFWDIAYEYLWGEGSKYEWDDLNKFINQTINANKNSIHSPLRKLARIKEFNIFINTTYDNLLYNALRSVRDQDIQTFNYNEDKKKLRDLWETGFLKSLKKNHASLVYNIFGNIDGGEPAFTERDIMERIINFSHDLKEDTYNDFFLELNGSSLLFIGCGYNDWLFRFFLRIIGNQPLEFPNFRLEKKESFKFISDCYSGNNLQLYRFLEKFDVEMYYSNGGYDFIDKLYDEIISHSGMEVIPESQYPKTAFISFEGRDRQAALTLAGMLEKDGIEVWLDQNDFKPGDLVDNTIIQAMKRCPVFIPLISANSDKPFIFDYDLKYHIQEWTWIHNYNCDKQNSPKTIMPLVIDANEWRHPYFKNSYYLKITTGIRDESYVKMKKRLLEIQETFVKQS